ncbi:MAG: bifunctional phosphopantothenoylcysteine decarboxylase/phosphopantothenate--cysteine ligase CoaBC [Candidatus Wallbacteria bacterium]|nr:bifunctional phosphopantothenoylcysteine decarboxylase/phosphopantothenate--cysteine ligase CoaBC [Candidatus Wallbacteria bacterium]
MLKDKNIILGVTGGIAAYKAPELVRTLRRKGAKVQVILTGSAERLVSSCVLATVSGERVYCEMFHEGDSSDIDHISLARWADMMIIAPVTANTMAKLACGIADNLLSSTVLSIDKPVLLCPAMNSSMWNKEITRANFEKLKASGFFTLGPEVGDLACGESGPGRMVEPATIADYAESIVSPKPLAGKIVLITAGPTQEAIDDVRFISNKSSGKMGYALARQAFCAGASVTLISGPCRLPVPQGVRLIRTISAADMLSAMLDSPADLLIMSAAVCDFTPEFHPGKADKREFKPALKLHRTPDLIAEYGKKHRRARLVAFAAEYGSKTGRAFSKLKEKKADLIIFNDVSDRLIGFDSDDNAVQVINRRGRIVDFARAPKQEIAFLLIEHIVRTLF